MHYLIAIGCLAVSCGLTTGFSDSIGVLTENMLLRYNIQKHEFCLLESRSDLIERCEMPRDGHMVPVDDVTVRFPRHSICHLKGSHPKVDTCIVCRGGSWETSLCTTAPSREKRFGWLLVAAAVATCFFLCGKKGGGGGNSNYIPPSFSSCDKPSSAVFYADRGTTSTTVTWPQPTAKDGSGNNISPELATGNGGPGSKFEKGFHMFQYKATDSKGFSDYCTISFEVRVHTCTLNWISHGNRNCNNNNYIFGTTCEVVCDDVYDPVGATDLTCEENGWDHPIPSCKPKQCPALSVGFQCTDTINFGSICSLSCDKSKGLSVTNPSITICLKSGNWYVPVPQCVDTSIPVFDNCPAQNIVVYAARGLETATVRWDDITATDNSGEVTVIQTEGQSSGSVFTEGTSVIKYKATDGEGNEAVCSFNVIVQVLTCGPPPYTDNKMRFDCTNQYVYGSTCSINCVGALLNGSNSITCEKDNAIPPQMHWQTSTSIPPHCIQTKCDNLTTPTNGALTCDANFAGSFCVMTCNTKWDIPITGPANGMYHCGWTSGIWFPRGNVPDCTVKRLPDEMRLPSELYYYTGDCSDSATQELIKQNHVTVLNSSKLFHPTGCISTGQCSVKYVEVRCGATTRRRRDTMTNSVGDDGSKLSLHRQKRSENVVIVSWDFSVKYECGSMSSEECVVYQENILNGMKSTTERMLSDGDFNPTTPGVTVRDDSYHYGYVTLQCGEGMKPVLSSGSCAVCPTGTMYNRTSSSCSDCPRGTYQNEDHSFSCKDCPQGMTTLSSGTKSSSDCHDMCQPGNLSATGIEPCVPCPSGRYQPSQGSTSCLPCPTGTTTQTTGVASKIGCQSYDLAIQGPSQMTTSWTANEAVNSFTLFFWVKINSVSPGLTIAFTNDQVKLQMHNTLSVTLQGNPPIPGGPMEVNKWEAITLIFEYSSKLLTLYKGNQVAFSVTFSSITSPVIASASTLTISCSDTEGVNIRAFSFIATPKTSSEIAALSSTCDITSESNTVMTLDDMTGGTSDKVTVNTPSSCDAVNECETSDLCNGHPCINTPGSYTCQCQDGYTGSDCSTPPDFCVGNQCENEATCVSGQTNYTCSCSPGFKGPLCEIQIIDGGYSNWTDWSTCPVRCGVGVETRFRTCDNPPPDADGKPCLGPDADNRYCNTEPCPVCRSSQLQQGTNNSESGPDCNGNESELQCQVVCKPGFYLSRDQISVYNCSDGQWTPTIQLPSCLGVVSPRELSLKTKVNYTNSRCLSKQESEGLKTTLVNKIRTLECEKLSSCTSKIDIPDCSRTSEGTTADITFTMELPEGDLNLETFTSTNTMSPGLQGVVEAIQTLEATAKQLQNGSVAILKVTSGGVTYTPYSGITVTADVSCPTGYFAEDGLCGTCPSGTRYDSTSRRCEFCEKGLYQDAAGQIDCKPCPGGTSTKYFGSTDISLCNVSPDKSTAIASAVTVLPVSSTTFAPTMTVAPVSSTTFASMVTVAPVGSTTFASTVTVAPVSSTTFASTVTVALVSSTTFASTVTVAPVSSTTYASTGTVAPVSYTATASTGTVAPFSSTHTASTITTHPTRASTVRSKDSSPTEADSTDSTRSTIVNQDQTSSQAPAVYPDGTTVEKGADKINADSISSTQIIIVSSVLGTLLLVAIAAIAVVCLKRSSAAKTKRKSLFIDDRHDHEYACPTTSTPDEYSTITPEQEPETHNDGGYNTIPDQGTQDENPYAVPTDIYNSIYDEEDLPARAPYYHPMTNGSYLFSDTPPSDYHV